MILNTVESIYILAFYKVRSRCEIIIRTSRWVVNLVIIVMGYEMEKNVNSNKSCRADFFKTKSFAGSDKTVYVKTVFNVGRFAESKVVEITGDSLFSRKPSKILWTFNSTEGLATFRNCQIF